MKLPPYAEYRPCESAALDRLPANWHPKRLRFCALVNPRSARLRELAAEDEVSFVPMEAVGEYGGLTLDQTRAITEVGAGYTEFDDGDVVVAKITPCFENGKGALAEGLVNGAAFGTTELHVLRAGGGLHERFLFYLTISHYFRSAGEGEMYGAGGQKRVPPEFCKNVFVPLPREDEQRIIADFLDRETARIDALVAKKRTLIERLKEKRTALISRTVTRGLPPDAARAAGLDPHPKLKSSGVEWLGEVPAHWGLLPLKYLVATPITDGPHETPEILDEGVPFVSAEAISEGRINFERIRGHISAEDHRRYSKKYKPKKGDIYMVKSGATTGRVAMVRTDQEFNIWSPLAAIRCDPKAIDREFLFTYMQSAEFQSGVSLSWSYGTQQNIGMNVIENLRVPLPPLQEQATVARFLQAAVGPIDEVTALASKAIDRLKEYRSAVVSAAVTGRIDVREALA